MSIGDLTNEGGDRMLDVDGKPVRVGDRLSHINVRGYEIVVVGFDVARIDRYDPGGHVGETIPICAHTWWRLSPAPEAESAPHTDGRGAPLRVGDRVCTFGAKVPACATVSALLPRLHARVTYDNGCLVEDEARTFERPEAESIPDEDMCQPCGAVLLKTEITYSPEGVPYCARCYRGGGTCDDCHHIGPSVRVGWDYTDRALCVYCGHRVADTEAARAGADSYEDWSAGSVVAAVEPVAEYQDSDRCGARVDWEFP